MCGIFGWILDPTVSTGERIALAVTLAHGNNERGSQSWGAWEPSGRFVTKAVGSILDGPHAMRLANRAAIAGHTRYATHGEVTTDNAHPFRAGDIVGAHNGCIWNHGTIAKQYGRAFDVDSMHLLAHIAEGRSLRELEGYGAVMWSDTRDRKPGFFLGRFDGELAVATLKGAKAGSVRGVVWSSETTTLRTALRMAGLDHTFVNVKDRRVYHASLAGWIKTARRLDVRPRKVTELTLSRGFSVSDSRASAWSTTSTLQPAAPDEWERCSECGRSLFASEIDLGTCGECLRLARRDDRDDYATRIDY